MVNLGNNEERPIVSGSRYVDWEKIRGEYVYGMVVREPSFNMLSSNRFLRW